VVDIRGDKVRLGINAPKEISVHRKEVYDAIRRENREAAQVKPRSFGSRKIAPRKSPRRKISRKEPAPVALTGVNWPTLSPK